MAELELDRILETCVLHGATELWLVPGRSPFLRIPNGESATLRELDSPALSAEDLRKLLTSVMPGDEFERCRELGVVEFRFNYSYRKRQFRAVLASTDGQFVARLELQAVGRTDAHQE